MPRVPSLRISKPEELAYFKGLIFGPHGNGKTRFLGTALDDERTSPMLYLAWEAGTQTLVGRDVDIVTMRDFSDFNDPYEVLSQPDHGGYRSVGIDSISEVQIEGMLSILDEDAKRPDPDIMGQPEWGKILIKMRRFVRLFKDLDVHVFFTALAKDDVLPRVGACKVPLLQGSFQDELPGIVDTVAYMAIEDLPDGSLQRLLLLHSNPRFSVKARTPWNRPAPAEIVDPTVSKLLDALGFAK